MNDDLIRRIYEEIDRFPIFDPHTHIDHHRPTAGSLGEILSYHYYTELCNSASYEQGWWTPDLTPDELVRRIAPKLPAIANTVQFSWFAAIGSEFLGFKRSDLQNPVMLLELHEKSKKLMSERSYVERVLERSRIKRLYLTNAFTDRLEGVDAGLFRPCLRIDPFTYATDPLSMLADMQTRTSVAVTDSGSFRMALGKLFSFFKERNCAYASVSAWPNTRIQPVEDVREDTLIRKMRDGRPLSESELKDHVSFAFIQVAEECRRNSLPFHLMIGVDKNVYAHGVEAGRDLVNSVNSLRGYDYLFNTYPDVRFPTSVLCDSQTQELTASAWIRHNVYPSGHWWYLNNPTDIASEVTRRLEVVPRPKIIGYYSDAYFLEFVLPKFRMYKFVLARVLAEKIQLSRIDPNMQSMGEGAAIELAWDILWKNAATIFSDIV